VLIESDCREVLARLPDSSADAIFLDPPYNLQLGRGRSRRAAGGRIVRGPVADWDCFESLGEYDALMQPILRQLLQVLRPTGSLWVCGTYHSVHRLGQQLQDMGAWFLSEVIWWIANPAPRPFWSSRPLQTHQTLLWVVRDRRCLHAVERRVDRSLLQEYSRRDLGRKQPVSIWKIGVCQGSERLRRADGSALHPAQKPLELLRRIIAVSTRPGEVVLDPMAGTGTTGVAAAELGRQALLVEANREYVAAARTRLSELTDRP
jgi:DNA modification methylase